MHQQNDCLFIFSGFMFVGKDHVAKQASLEVKGFADPIYQLCESLCGTKDKSVPGIRRWMQVVGQWGWGCANDEYPNTPERSQFTRMIRRDGRELTRDFKWVNWSEYGSRKDFWVNILLTRLGLVGQLFERDHDSNYLFPEMRNGKPYRIGITNARFAHELDTCTSVGFAHYHVRCTEETRRERMLMSNYAFDPKADNDVSELLAGRLDKDIPDYQVIWNDFRPMPEGHRFLTVSEFVTQSERTYFDMPTIQVRTPAVTTVAMV